MKKAIFLFSISIFLLANISKAQTTNKGITEHDPTTAAKDAKIKTEMIDYAVESANVEGPNWDALYTAIKTKYDSITADRTVTKAKIYFYCNQDWPEFCTAIVNYTNHYELKDDYKLLNLNASMILKTADDQSQLKEALRWAKAAFESDHSNTDYKATYVALKAKINQ
jgi:hypothetical protein